METSQSAPDQPQGFSPIDYGPSSQPKNSPAIDPSTNNIVPAGMNPNEPYFKSTICIIKIVSVVRRLVEIFYVVLTRSQFVFYLDTWTNCLSLDNRRKFKCYPIQWKRGW